MAYSTILRAAARTLLPVLLGGGCCANSVCNCPGEDQADAVRLLFAAGFSRADLDTLVVQRYPKINKTNAKPDVVTLVRTPEHAYDTLFINNSAPFAPRGTTKLDGYSYRVRYLRHATGRRNNAELALVLDSVQLRGSLAGDGCCTCYTNQSKVVFVRPDTARASNTPVELPRSGIYRISK